MVMVTDEASAVIDKYMQPGNPSKRAWGYIRVSTRRQAAFGVSLEEQRKAIEEHCKQRGLTLMGIFEDGGTSGSKSLRHRTGGLQLCGSVERGDTIVAKSMDRLFRNHRDAVVTCDQWRNVDGVYVSIINMRGMTVDNSSAMGSFIFGMLTLFAELERELALERTRDCGSKTVDRTQSATDAPPGYRWRTRSGRWVLVEHKETQEQIDILLQMYQTKKWSLRNLASWAQKEFREGRMKRIHSRRRLLRPTDKGYDPSRNDVWGKWRLEEPSVPWSYPAVARALKRRMTGVPYLAELGAQPPQNAKQPDNLGDEMMN